MSGRSERAARAMAHLPESDPALASLALWCDVVDGERSTHSSGDRISIGAEFDTLPLREQIGLLGHHILHVALRHGPRQSAMAQRMGDTFSANLFNLAADAIVNSVLEAGGHALPRPAVTLPSLLRDALQDTGDTTALSDWDAERLYTELNAQDKDGKARSEAYMRAKAFSPDLDENSLPENSDRDAEWTGHLIRATEGAGGSGRGIGSVLVRLCDLPRSGTPWDILLRRLLTKAVSDLPRQSWRRPRGAWVAAEAHARKNGTAAPVFEPGQARNAARPRIAIGLDSSGSISAPVLSVFAGEVASIARRSGAELHLLYFDEVVYDTSRPPPGQIQAALTSAPLRRAGGTSFVDVMEKASALAPSIIVMLTDLDGPFGPPPPHRVIWATPSEHWKAPPFGQVISLAR